MAIRILFLSDTHLGFDYPFTPRVERRRRGPDFFEMYNKALEPAKKKEVDIVIHGGDIFFRSKIPPIFVQMAFDPLKDLADNGIPIFIVPGNHERSIIPYRLLASHKNIHIFSKPRSFFININGIPITLSGFPYIRDNIRLNFQKVLKETGWYEKPPGPAFLCMHHIVEGASVKVGDKFHVFRSNSDVIRTSDLPIDASAVLSGHIHRFQILSQDLYGKRIPTSVFYPGSTERTSFAEKDESKGYLILTIEQNDSHLSNSKIDDWKFMTLPARPVIILDMFQENCNITEFHTWLNSNLRELPQNSIIKIRFPNGYSKEIEKTVTAAWIRAHTPISMNIETEFRRFTQPKSYLK